MVTEETDTEIWSLGSATWAREDLSQGVEADECFYIQHEEQVRGKDGIDLALDPPPDLVLEIDMTRSSLNRMAIYAALGVPEVWRYDGSALTFYGLRGQTYVAQEQSQVLPLVRRDDLLPFLENRLTMGETSLVRQFRQWVRNQLQEQG